MYYNSVLPGLLITRCWKVYVSTGITISRRGTLIIKGYVISNPPTGALIVALVRNLIKPCLMNFAYRISFLLTLSSIPPQVRRNDTVYYVLLKI